MHCKAIFNRKYSWSLNGVRAVIPSLINHWHMATWQPVCDTCWHSICGNIWHCWLRGISQSDPFSHHWCSFHRFPLPGDTLSPFHFHLWLHFLFIFKQYFSLKQVSFTPHVKKATLPSSITIFTLLKIIFPKLSFKKKEGGDMVGLEQGWSISAETKKSCQGWKITLKRKMNLLFLVLWTRAVADQKIASVVHNTFQ